MRFRNSLKLMLENFKHVYKLLLVKLVITLIACALCCAFVLPELNEIWNSTQVQGLVENIKAFLSKLLAGRPTEMEEFKNKLLGENGSFAQVARLLASMRLEIALTVIGCIVVYLLRRFAETVCHFATGSMLNDKMGTYAETPFFTALVANLGKASVYSLVYVPVVFLFDALTLFICYLVLSVTSILLGLFLSVTVITACQALKLMVTSLWMPAMTADNKGVFQAMRYTDKIERKQRTKVYSNYFVSVYLIIIVNFIAAISTFGSALLITVPASYFFLICQQYVNYYTMKGKKYFLTYEHIESNPDRGDSEHFFEYIAETATAEESEVSATDGENENV